MPRIQLVLSVFTRTKALNTYHVVCYTVPLAKCHSIALLYARMDLGGRAVS